MGTEKYILGPIVILAGLLFLLFNKGISKGALEFYRRFYTAKNLRILFICLGIFFIFIGIVIFVKA